jgi:CRP/FNR family cyclic AMP-dependent transcriptional regulator
MNDATDKGPYWTKLIGVGTRKRVPAGRMLVQEGDPGGQLFLITQGEFRAFSCNEAGREITYGNAGPGEVIGEMALDGGPRSADVVATSASEVVVIERDTLRELMRENPDIAFDLIERIIRRARIAMNSTRNMALLDAYGRLTQALESIALPPSGPDGVRETAPISQAELASRVGCSREMVSRLMNDLAKGGYVETSRRRIVLKKKFPSRW